MIVDTQKIVGWKRASKTCSIKAKSISNILIDPSVESKFLIATLEGNESLGKNSIICIGDAGDAWQQTPLKLLAKYTVTTIDDNGWLICTPKPDNEVNCIEVDRKVINQFAMVDENKGWYGTFLIIGQWGETVGDMKNVQKGTEGDFICQNQKDPCDVWIVKRKIFLNTYKIL